MYTTVETIETNKVKLTFNATPEQLEDGMKYSYNKNKGKFNIPGFRKGKAPRKLIEMHYGAGVLVDDAVNHILPDIYAEAVKEAGIKTVSKPEVDIKEMTEEGVTFTADVFTYPNVSVDGYLALTYKPFNTDVEEEEVDKKIDKERENNARLVVVEDRQTRLGDTVVIDFEGFVEGIQFEGGAATDTELELGSGRFIPGFEDQLVGYSTGDEVEVNVSFPEQYQVSELAGQPAMFKVTIKEMREKILPDADDDFAQDVSEFETLDEYKNYIRENIEKEKHDRFEEDKNGQLAERLGEILVGEIPEIMFDEKVEEYLYDLEHSLSHQGINLDDYFNYIGIDEETYRQRARQDAVQNVKARLALEKIAETENVEVSDEELEEEKEKIAKSYGREKEKFFARASESLLESIKMDIKVRKALKIVSDSAVAESSVLA